MRIKSVNDLGAHVRIRSEIPASIRLPKANGKSECTNSRANSSPAHTLLSGALMQKALVHELEFKGAVPFRKFRLDVAFPNQKLAIEVDGWQHHGKTLDGFKKDREKQNLLVLNGWRVLRFSAGEIMQDVNQCVVLIEQCLKG